MNKPVFPTTDDPELMDEADYSKFVSYCTDSPLDGPTEATYNALARLTYNQLNQYFNALDFIQNLTHNFFKPEDYNEFKKVFNINVRKYNYEIEDKTVEHDFYWEVSYHLIDKSADYNFDCLSLAEAFDNVYSIEDFKKTLFSWIDQNIINSKFFKPYLSKGQELRLDVASESSITKTDLPVADYNNQENLINILNNTLTSADEEQVNQFISLIKVGQRLHNYYFEDKNYVTFRALVFSDLNDFINRLVKYLKPEAYKLVYELSQLVTKAKSVKDVLKIIEVLY